MVGNPDSDGEHENIPQGSESMIDTTIVAPAGFWENFDMPEDIDNDEDGEFELDAELDDHNDEVGQEAGPSRSG